MLFETDCYKLIKQAEKILRYYKDGVNDAPCNVTYLKYRVERLPFNIGGLEQQIELPSHHDYRDVGGRFNDLQETLEAIIKHGKPEIYQVKKVLENSEQYIKDLKVNLCIRDDCMNKEYLWKKGRNGRGSFNDAIFLRKNSLTNKNN